MQLGISVGAAVVPIVSGASASVTVEVDNPGRPSVGHRLAVTGAGGPLPSGVSVLSLTPLSLGLRAGNSAFVASSTAGPACSAGICTFDAPAGKTHALLTLKVDFRVADQTKLRLVVDGDTKGAAFITLSVRLPVIAVALVEPGGSSKPITVRAGQTAGTAELRLAATDRGLGTLQMGPITLPRVSNGVVLSPVDGGGCIDAVGDHNLLTCASMPGSASDFGQLSVTAMPDLTKTSAIPTSVLVTDSVNPTEQHRFALSMPVMVTPRGADDPIKMTGPFDSGMTGARLNQPCSETPATGTDIVPTHCLTQIPAAATILWAQLTWTWKTGTSEGSVQLLDPRDPTRPISLTDHSIPTPVDPAESVQSRTETVRADDLPRLADEKLRVVSPGHPDHVVVGGWSLTVVWTGASGAASHSVSVENTLTRYQNTATVSANDTSFMFDFDNPSAPRMGWTFSVLGVIRGQVASVDGARVFVKAAAGTLSPCTLGSGCTDAPQKVSIGLVIGPTLVQVGPAK